MKNLRYIILLMGISLIMFSCEEDKITYNGPSEANFLQSERTFYVQDVANPVDTITIGALSVEGRERKIKFDILTSSTAEADKHYKFKNNEVVVPANSALGYIVVEGIYDNLAIDGPQQLNIKLKATDDFGVAGFRDTINFTLRQYCPFVIDDLVGDYDVVYSWWYDDNAPHPAKLEKVDENTLKWVAPFVPGNDILIKLDASNPANFTASVASQLGWAHPTYGDISFVASGTFSSCDKTITLSGNHVLADGRSFGFKPLILTKK